MANRIIDGFVLEEAAVVCPECHYPFTTEIMVESRKINSSDVIEADLHRVFNEAELRAALLANCPNCKFCAWKAQFKPYGLKPELLKREPKIEASKKYALAVKWARHKNVHALDIAFIALNGLWCARESGEVDNLWLELAIYEHERGVASSFSRAEDDGITHLIMGELYRQHRDFEKAESEYALAELDRTIAAEILQHVRMMCQRKFAGVSALPLKLARLYFEVEDLRDNVENSESSQSESLLAASETAEPETAASAGIEQVQVEKGIPAESIYYNKGNSGNNQSGSVQDLTGSKMNEMDFRPGASSTANASLGNSEESNRPSSTPLVAAISSLFSSGATLTELIASSNPAAETVQDSQEVAALEKAEAANAAAAEKAAAVKTAAEKAAAVKAAAEKAAAVNAAAEKAAAVKTAAEKAAAEKAAAEKAAAEKAAAVKAAAEKAAAEKAAAVKAAAEKAAAEKAAAEKAAAVKAAAEKAAAEKAAAAKAAAEKAAAEKAAAEKAAAEKAAAEKLNARVAALRATKVASPSPSSHETSLSAELAKAERAASERASQEAESERLALENVAKVKAAIEQAIIEKEIAAIGKAEKNESDKKGSSAEAAQESKEPVKRVSRASAILSPSSSTVSISLVSVSSSAQSVQQAAGNNNEQQENSNQAGNKNGIVSDNGSFSDSVKGSRNNSTDSDDKNKSATEPPRLRRIKPPREEHYFARRTLVRGVVPNASGWINDYGNSNRDEIANPSRQQSNRKERLEPVQSKPSEQTSPSRAKESPPDSGLHDAPAISIGGSLPGLAIDDQNRGKDYSDAINRVEKYLSFSRKVYSRDWMKL